MTHLIYQIILMISVSLDVFFFTTYYTLVDDQCNKMSDKQTYSLAKYCADVYLFSSYIHGVKIYFSSHE